MAQNRTNSSGISSTPIRSKDSKKKKKHEDTDKRERERESDRLEIGDLIVRQTGRPPPLSERCSSYSLCKLRKKKKNTSPLENYDI